MTMQVGIVGSNGAVIASDKRRTSSPLLRPNQLWASGIHGTNSSKMVIDRKKGIAVSAARDLELALDIAREITAHLPDDQYQNPVLWIEDKARKILERVRREHNDPNERLEAGCIVMVQRPVHKLFQFQFGIVDGQWGPYCQEMDRLAVAGDNTNAALFWPEAYYNCFPHGIKRLPVKSLIPLAAYTVVLAHRFTPINVNGLEVVFCDETGLHKLSDQSITDLQDAAVEWDRHFGKAIFDYSQNFSFEPPD